MFGRKPLPPKEDIDYERVGRAVEQVLVKDYIDMLHSTRRQIWGAFVRGLFMGLGTVLGATVLVALLLAALQAFGGAPLIGQYIKDVAEQIQAK
jgi:hypothetical protein